MDKEESSQSIKPPIIWRMEPYIENLIELTRAKSPELAIKILLAIMEFNKTCADAESALYKYILHEMREYK
jgi:hypothetical protein